MATNPWSLPTTGNLAFDDYRRAIQAWSKAHPYVGDEQYDSRGVQDLVGGGIDSVSNLNPERDEWGQKQNAAFYKQLTPDQLAEWQRLAEEHDAKVNRNGKLAAALSFAAVGGLGALGSGGLGGGAAAGGSGLGGLDAASVYGAGSGWGADTLGAMGLGGAEAAGGAGLGGGGLGMFGTDLTAGGLAGMTGETGGLGGLEWLGGLGSGGGAGLGGGAAAGSGLLQQIQNVLKGGGTGASDLLKQLGGSGGGVNWLNLLGNLGSGWLQSNAAGNASDAQLQAARESNALLEKMWQQGRADQAPYREAGTSALAGIQALLKDPNSITSMPDYQFGLDQGSKTLQNSASARGMTYSGQQSKALQKYGNDYAGTKLNESYNRLAGLAGVGQQATNQTGAMGATYANQMANNITDQGNARGSGYIGQGNAWNNAIGGALNGLSEQSLIDALLNRGGN